MGTKFRKCRGTTAVEFAIICSSFFLFLFGIIDFGYFFFNRHVVTDAAREGARMAILDGVTEAEVRTCI